MYQQTKTDNNNKMHPKFVDIWCRNYSDAWEEKGKEAAVRLLNEQLTDEERLLVKRRLPAYVKERESVDAG